MLLKEISPDDYEKIGKLFTTKLGEEVLDSLSKTFYNSISFTPGDSHITAFKEGQRDIIQVLRKSAEAQRQRNEEKE